MMLIATREVEFSFNNQMYKQLDAVAMGSPLGPALANIFLSFYEGRLSTTPQNQLSNFDMLTILMSFLALSWNVVISIKNSTRCIQL